MLLAVDPGIRGAGCALYSERELVAAAYVRNPYRHGNKVAEALALAYAIRDWAERNGLVASARARLLNAGAHAGAFEWPVSYKADQQKGDQNDLLPLPAIVTAVAAAVGLEPENVRTYTPSEWKGTLDKDVMIERIKGRLRAEEALRVVQAGALTHNVWDGVGIGLHFLGRLQRVRIFAGST